MSSSFASAGAVVRAAQSDASQRNALRQQAHDAAVAAFGIQFAMRHRTALTCASDALYGALSTRFFASQSVGEQFADIVATKNGALLGNGTRIGLLALECVLPHVVPQLPRFVFSLRNSFRELADNPRVRRPVRRRLRQIAAPSSAVWTRIRTALEWLRSAVPELHRLHTALFYVTGAYYDVVRRLLSVRYVENHRSPPGTPRPSYALLGALLFARSVLLFVAAARTHFENQKATSRSAVTQVEVKSNADSTDYQCVLCMGECNLPTILPCGHLFCWQCVASWLATNVRSKSRAPTISTHSNQSLSIATMSIMSTVDKTSTRSAFVESVRSERMSSPLSDEEAAPLKLLLGAKSKGIVDKIVCEVFKQLHASLDKRALIEQSLEQALSLAAADAASLHVALRQFVSVALRVAHAHNNTIDPTLVLPNGFHAALSALLCEVVTTHAAEWRDSAIVRQPSLPRLVDVDWRVDVKTASDSAAQMSVPTVLMRLTLAGDGSSSSSSSTGNEAVTFELTRDALKTLLESMTKIRSQLQSIAQ